MRTRRFRTFGAVAVLAVVAAATVVPATAQSDDGSAQVILDWNKNTLAAAATAKIPPPVIDLYMGMVHGAMYDAVVSIAGGYTPYLGAIKADPTASKVAAAATAAHDVLTASFPIRRPTSRGSSTPHWQRSPRARPRMPASRSAQRPPRRCSRHARTTAAACRTR